ncbi:enoyl-CoA hydratase-related protein [Parageobacillus thermoglucosidasius]|uniref:enoyl-CoA hydratase-related protein n=1 Tax=Parageobacillus thermoglucosidasius TaxID=1426 RepID=UPI0001D18BF0|nr:enoyl-CoA hydratase-related protein [Parageobacillus thermoglucosidasius]AEH47564.1 Methylglutaconyl-CoA hydratase [Parageobacillus thermoglucosidasius C56-YS93]RDE31476.1 enoyl-CoA hydratase [Parageobacillus thermoglucosidasius]GCD82240.1 putative enoyl-CoA hydratase/isomerase YngF [Parageobacillus thermoglucosidasius]GMN99148.1 enoyl-CoA hydratase [Parageobacillus thermoglucosidasius]
MEMIMANVLVEKRDHIGYVTLHRPEAMNCFDYATLCQLGEAVERIHLNRDIRVVIFTGAGDKAFSAGADLKERKTLNEMEVRRNVKKIRDVFNAVANLPQPTIAAVNGYAFGGGFELMLACDFRIAVKGAIMGLTEVSWAIIPGAGGTQRLPRLIGEAKAKELILTARKITAEQAYEYGLLTNVVEKENLMPSCEALAHEMMQNGPIALQQAKYAIQQGMNVDLQTGLAIEAKAYELTIPTKDRLEALAAFSEKRKPQFTGE